jgi:outer membrane protein
MERTSAAFLGSLLAILSAPAAPKDLLGVFQDALHNDPVIRGADATRRANRETRPQAIAALLPQVNGTAQSGLDRSTSYQQFLNPYPNPNPGGPPFIAERIQEQTTSQSAAPSKQWGLNLRQNVFSWSNWMTLKEANAQVAQAEANYQAAQQNLILRVSQAYFAVLTDIDNLDAQQASLEAFSRQLDQANKRFEVGLIAITDVEEAKAARDNAAAQVILAKRTLATAEDQLAEITGQKYDSLAKPGPDMPLNMPSPASEDRWVEISMEQNLQLIASRLAADIARDNVHVAFGGHLPTLDIVAGRTYMNSSTNENLGSNGVPLGTLNDLASRTNDRNISLQLSMPIFSGGLTQSRVRQAQYLWIAAKEAVVQASRATERQARDAYLGVISGIAQVQARRQALESNQTALKATQAGYEVGTRTAVDLVRAQQTLVQAQTDYFTSRYDYIVEIINLRLAAGNLDQAQVAEINGWLKTTALTSPSSSPTPESLTPPGPTTQLPQVPINPTTVRPPEGAPQPPGREPRRPR